MRIGFDLRSFLKQETGVGTYLRDLLSSLARIDEGNEYFLLSSSWKDRFPREKIPAFHRMRFRDLRLPVRFLNYCWSGWRRPYLDSFFSTTLDLTHSPTPLILPTRGKKLVTVHDLFFLDHPDQVDRETRKKFLKGITSSLAKADGVLTFSRFTGNEVRARFDLDEKRVRVVYHGLNPEFFEAIPEERLRAAKKRLGLPDSFILFVGALEPRKNLLRLLDALKVIHVRYGKTGLVLAGPPGEDSRNIEEKITRLGLAEWVRLTGYLPREDIRSLYRLAEALVFPSRCEGFGFPLLEAMAGGLPVAASGSTALAEIGGDSALYFRAEDPESMAGKIIELLSDDRLRHELREKGKKRAQGFSWEKAARETLEFYGEIVGERA